MLESRLAKFVNIIKEVLSSPYFILFTAGYYLVMNYVGGDLATIYFVGITGTLMVLLLDDLTPLAAQIPFMSLIVSNVNAPTAITVTLGGAEYVMRPATDLYSDTAFLIQVGLVIGVYAVAFCARLVLTVRRGKLTLTPATVLLFPLACAFLLNGVFAPDYKINHLAYGAIMAFFFVVIFITFKDNVKVTRENLTLLAYSFCALGALLCVELSIAYITAPIIIFDGVIVKELVVFGWGIWNTLGMLLTMCIPFAFYLATVKKRGYLWFLYASLLLLAAFAGMSRQGMLGSAFVYAVSWAFMLVQVKDRRARTINIIISAVLIVSAASVFIALRSKIFTLFGSAGENLVDGDGNITGNGRIDLIRQAFENFLKGPVFGAGFFAEVNVSAEFVGVGAIPCMYHDTFAQLLGACGIYGLLTYAVYRAFTVVEFIKTASWEKAFVALSVLGLLLVSLVDNHIFYIYPTMTYSALMAFVLGKPQKAAEEAIPADGDGREEKSA